jgi:hypothetical protein
MARSGLYRNSFPIEGNPLPAPEAVREFSDSLTRPLRTLSPKGGEGVNHLPAVPACPRGDLRGGCEPRFGGERRGERGPRR